MSMKIILITLLTNKIYCIKKKILMDSKVKEKKNELRKRFSN